MSNPASNKLPAGMTLLAQTPHAQSNGQFVGNRYLTSGEKLDFDRLTSMAGIMENGHFVSHGDKWVGVRYPTTQHHTGRQGNTWLQLIGVDTEKLGTDGVVKLQDQLRALVMDDLRKHDGVTLSKLAATGAADGMVAHNVLDHAIHSDWAHLPVAPLAKIGGAERGLAREGSAIGRLLKTAIRFAHR